MKKFLFAVVVAAGTLFAGNTQAQTKIGYVRIDDIVSVMPELAPEKVNLDTVGAQFVKDSIMPSIEFKQDEYNAVVAELGDTSKTITDAVKKLKFQKMQALQQELSGAEQYIQQVLQAKQQEYLRPFYAKAKKAIEAVAKKKGYAYVLNTDVFVVAPEADDISLAVVTELGIKLPEQPKTAPAAKPAAQPAKPAGK
jgi:outer membrane protein